MSDHENIEFRFILIGEPDVGIKNIINRFKILNCSSTIDHSTTNNNNLLKKQVPEIKEVVTMNKTYSQSLSQQSQSQSLTGTNFQKRKLINIENYTKVLNISNFNIELRFFDIPSAERVQFNDNLNEEMEEVEKNHKMKFDKVKNEVQKVILKSSKPYTEVKYVFLFVFDLSKYETFEKVKIYYEELNKNLRIDDQHFKALIGNKVDIKVPFKVKESNFEKFVENNNFNYYEISTKMFFSFENFFQRIFFDLFEKVNEHFPTTYFKERFSHVMTLKPT
jgi:hypothetical protein